MTNYKYFLVWVFEKDKGAIMSIDKLVSEMHIKNNMSDEMIAWKIKKDLSADQIIKAENEEHAISLFNNKKDVVRLNFNSCIC